MQADSVRRETWSLAFQLRMFVPCDVQLHLPASLCTSTLGHCSKDVFRTVLDRQHQCRPPTTHIVAKLIRKLLVNLATPWGVYRESA
jgi:hypothetical protein